MPDENRGWQHVTIDPFRQDLQGWADPVTEEYHPPTMNWYSRIKAKRTDGELFYVVLTIDNDELNSSVSVLDLLCSRLQNAMLTLEGFRTCDCAKKEKCERHKERT